MQAKATQLYSKLTFLQIFFRDLEQICSWKVYRKTFSKNTFFPKHTSVVALVYNSKVCFHIIFSNFWQEIPLKCPAYISVYLSTWVTARLHSAFYDTWLSLSVLSQTKFVILTGINHPWYWSRLHIALQEPFLAMPEPDNISSVNFEQ